MVAGGNAAALLATLATRRSDWSAARVRLVSIAGVAGIAVGGGLDLLFDVDDEDTAIFIPMATSALGLIVGAVATRNVAPDDRAASGTTPALAFVNIDNGLRFGLPVPLPAPGHRGRTVRVPLLHARF